VSATPPEVSAFEGDCLRRQRRASYGSEPSDNRTRSVTPTADANGVGSHDPLSDVCALFPQVGDYIGQLCGIF